jgi:uncharacterized protein (TIGR02145 family)
MRRELYINGRLADIDGVSIPLNFACSEIADLSGVSGNYSLTVKLPLTGNNILIAYFANLPNVTPAALWPGYKTTGSYFIDGVPIFQNADVKLLSTEKSIDVNITFGNLAWLDVLSNIKLKDIVTEFIDPYVFDWNYWILDNETSDIRWVMADYGGTFESGIHVERLHPSVNVLSLWDAIWLKLVNLGVAVSAPLFSPESDLWLPVISQVLNPDWPVGANFILGSDLTLTDNITEDRTAPALFEFTYTTPNPGIVFDQTLLHPLSYADRYFIVPKDGNYRVQMSTNLLITSTGFDGVIVDINLKVVESGDIVHAIFADSYASGVGNQTHPIEFDQLVKLTKGQVLFLEIAAHQEGEPGYACTVELEANASIFSIDYVPVTNKKDTLEFLMPFDVGYNMPDISCKDFVKAIMQLYGLLVENKNTAGNIENSPVMFNLDSLTGTTFENWSDKLVSFDRPKIEWNLGFKQRNYLRYATDETDNIFEDAYFTTYETDNAEKDLFKSIFAATDDVSLIGTSYFPFPVCSIPLWVVDGETWKYEGKAKQRIFRAYQTGTTFEREVVQLYNEGYTDIMVDETAYISYFKTIPSDVTDTGQGLDMASILAKYYTGFIEAVKSNRLFTFQFLLNQIDINKFTHITPVWIAKFSNFFFTKKVLNWEAGRVCNVEMLQLRDSGALGVVVPITVVKYGLLYNWYAATDARGICADGWEVPTSEDAIALRTYLGGGPLAGGKLKEAGVLHWLSPNVDATNEVGFNARGSGSRAFADGAFPFGDVAFMYQFNMWTIGEGKTIYNCTNDSSYFESNNYVGGEAEGSSIRPIKTSTTLTHGQSGTYTGNDGKIYRTICIGTQEWLADNLCETKFRNGEYIPGFDGGVYAPITNAAWAALTTAALCAYNDDTDNI